MIDLEHELRTVSESSTALGLRFAVVGGLAVSTRSEPRLTRDADLAVAVVDDLEAESTIRALATAGYRVVTLLEQEATGRLATVRLARSTQAVVVDLLFASSGIEPEIVLGAEQLALRAVASDDDWQVAERGVDLIVQRGFSRGRDLRAAVRTLRKDGAY